MLALTQDGDRASMIDRNRRGAQVRWDTKHETANSFLPQMHMKYLVSPTLPAGSRV
jgi:hypothetical protein